jgi:two-component system sensor histidine kinase ChiS
MIVSIRVKLVVIFSLLIIAAILPVSLFSLKVQERERLREMKERGRDIALYVTRLSTQILVSNGGDPRIAKIDTREYIGEGLLSDTSGLIGAEVGLIRGNVIIFSYPRDVRMPVMIETEREYIIDNVKVREGRLSNGDNVYVFIARGSAVAMGGRDLCEGRVMFSQSIIQAPIARIRMIVMVATVLSVFVMGLAALVLSRFISRPIYQLIDEVKTIETGNFSIPMRVHSHDEIGKLATTFYHLSRMIDMEIRELRKANIELKRLDELKDEFLANMSHELRTPLYGMIGIAESLIDGASGGVSRETRDELSLIVSSGMRLSNLINDILDFSRLKHHDIIIKKEPVDLHSVTDHVMSVLKPLAHRKNILMVNKIEPGTIFAEGDESRLVQIVMNLVGNAVKFTDEGSVTVDASLVGTQVTLEVTDTGIGVSADRIDRIFESFEQGDGSTARAYGGTGLGLAVTKRLVELHGGNIMVESHEGRGSRFIISLPSAVEAKKEKMRIEQPAIHVSESGMISPAVPVERETAKGTVLVVDDDPVNVQILFNNLSLASYYVITAQGGEEAIELVDREQIDCVILDIMMPRMSGFEVCRRLRVKHPVSDLPVIMLSAKGRTEEIVAGIEAGANDYLVKPVLRQELVVRVESLIALKKSLIERDELTSLKREIHVASLIQTAILGTEMPIVAGLSIGYCYVPSYEVGGDFYDMRSLPHGKLGVMIADVSGHGIPAALLCSMVKIGCSYTGEDEPASSVLAKLNHVLFPHMGGSYITACYAVIDREAMKIKYANAGHWPPIIVRDGAVIVCSKNENGMPLGWILENYVETTYETRSGDRFILYTDCFMEERRSKTEMYGEKRFTETLLATRSMNPTEAAYAIVKVLRAWAGVAENDGHLSDDATIVIVDIE